MRKNRAPRRVTRPGVGRDRWYLAWVRTLPCLLEAESYSCNGPVHAHHAGPKRLDRTAVPLCMVHHDQWHSANGYFRGWERNARRAWAEIAISVTQQRHDRTEAPCP